MLDPNELVESIWRAATRQLMFLSASVVLEKLQDFWTSYRTEGILQGLKKHLPPNKQNVMSLKSIV